MAIASVDSDGDRLHLERPRRIVVVGIAVAARRMHGPMQERLRVHAAQVENTGADFDGVTGLGLRERVLDRDARRVLIEAIAGVYAAGLHEPGTDALVVSGR